MMDGIRYLVLSGDAAGPVPPGARVVAASDHVRERLVQSGRWTRSEIELLAFEPVTRASFVEAADFERRRYESYLPVLASRLSRMHRLSKSVDFWEGVIGLTLLMHVSNCRRVFSLARRATEERIDHVVHAATAFDTPANEQDYRTVFQYAETGDDQLFAALVGESLPQAPAAPPAAAAAPTSLPRRVADRARRLAELLGDDPLLIVRELAARLVGLLGPPTLIATHCFWPRGAKRRMEIVSRGRIRYEDLHLAYPRAVPDTSSEARSALAEAPANGDAFDRFFFETLRWAAPRSWCEDFAARHAAARQWLDDRPSVRCIANESMDEDTSLVLGLGRERGIRVLYCEHNYLQHQFVGNLVWHLERKADTYLSLGWSRPEHPRIVPGGSLYQWAVPRASTPDIDVLFVAGVSMIRGPFSSAGYGEAAFNAAGYFAMTGAFLDALSPSTRARTYYKDYPTHRRAALGLHAREDTFLAPVAASLGTVDRSGRVPTTRLISRARLVVVNYLSTPYNEALLADVPTVILFNAAAYHLTDAERSFYDDLIAVGIVQPDPIAAAGFVESVVDDPDEWWARPDVRAARRRYLASHFRGADALAHHLLDAAAPARPDATLRTLSAC